MSVVWIVSVALLCTVNTSGLVYLMYTILYGKVKIYQTWIATFAVVMAYSLIVMVENFVNFSVGVHVASNFAGYILYGGIKYFTQPQTYPSLRQ